ncbi:FAD-binding domain-containing protein [Tothia fuscella]|uniref:FAD-binding domain-containing protein n=1 Tax=Tothia fuscella TaxID=1048955 RepID=A0A9P4NIQ8_9PEZI|nr:FAD-binding domain-containing protein [Tothia fuscella]
MKALTLSLLLPWAIVQAADPKPAEAATCLILPSDPEWPERAVWRTAMREIEKGKSTPEKKHPDYRLEATTVDEVIAAVNFAKQHRVRFSILNSGHDFHGRNDAPNGLSLVVEGLRGVNVLADFTPSTQGAPSVNSTTKTNVLPPQAKQAYVTFGAGYSTQLLNDQIAPSKLFTVGAAHGEVTVAGGWGQTSGHSPMSPRYGLGADQVVEYKVVTADGELKIANAVSNPDLFWALRGGGGGTYGVVVEATVKAYPSPPVVTASFWINATDYNDNKSIYPAAAWLHSKFPEWTEKGVSAYYYVYPNGMSLYIMNSGKEGTVKWLEENVKPDLQHLGTFPGMDNKSMSYRPVGYPSYKAFFDATFGAMDATGAKPPKTNSRILPRHGPGEMGMPVKAKGISPMDSWLFSAEHLKSPQFADALAAGMPKLQDGQYRGQLIGGGKVLTEGNDTSVLPAWRKTIAHIVLTGLGQPNVEPLRRFASNMGAYSNEASYKTPGWKEAFFGTHYEKLSQIKKKYDPTGLFWVTPGIGADDWVVRDGRLCRDTSTGQRTVDRRTELAPASDNQNFVDQAKDDETKGAAFPLIQGPKGAVQNRFYGNVNLTAMGLGGM